MLTNASSCGIIIKRLISNGGIAQLARATGSYPVGHGFKSNSRYHRPVGQAAKTPPFHGGNGSSILPRVTNNKRTLKRVSFYYWCLVAQATRHMQRMCGSSHSPLEDQRARSLGVERANIRALHEILPFLPVRSS